MWLEVVVILSRHVSTTAEESHDKPSDSLFQLPLFEPKTAGRRTACQRVPYITQPECVTSTLILIYRRNYKIS